MLANELLRKLLYSTISTSRILNKRKNVGEINPLFAIVHDPDAKKASAQMIHSTYATPQNTLMHPDTRYVFRFSRYVLR